MGSVERRNEILLLMTAAFLVPRVGAAEDNGRYLLSIRAGLLTFVEGKPTVTMPAVGHHNQRVLEPGNRLETHHGDKVEISLGPGNYLRVGEDTQVVAVQTTYNRMCFVVKTGTVILQAPRVDKKSLALEVSTPSGNLTVVKGGRWRLEVSPSGEVEVLAFKGILEWFSQEQKIATLTRGNHYTLGSPSPGELQQLKLERRRKDYLDRWSDRRSGILLQQEFGINRSSQGREHH